jgi:hypothetical protein
VTAASVADWCTQGREELLRARGPAAQTEAEILRHLDLRMAVLHALAHRTYSAWTMQLERPLAISLGAALG